MRINKYIAQSGFCSRRAADNLLDDGRVMINNKIATKGDDVREQDIVRIDGQKIKVKENRLEYYILNKPKRVICTSQDDKFDRVTAVSLIKSRARLFTYGRLDYMTEGLIIVSNDGELYNHIMHPSQRLYKSYIVKLDREMTDEHIEIIKRGVVIKEDDKKVRTAPAKVKRLNNKTEIRIAIFEGRNRQIRKMVETLGYNVKSLKRVKIGDLTLGTLEVGKYRSLTPEEIKYLKSL